MVGQAATANPPNEPVSVTAQKEQVEQAQQSESNGYPAELKGDAAQAAMKVQEKYAEERQKRLRDDGEAQYVDLSLSEKFKYYAEDPWVDERSDQMTIQDGEHIKYLVLGAGWGGVTFGVKLVQAGISASEIKIVDSAGGFGGTWYYNRYPGLMCDIESYCYLPFLEEMGYTPKHKYSYGEEIREYINAVTDKFGLSDVAMFSTKINSLEWDESKSQWKARMTKMRRNKSTTELTVTANMVFSASGLLLHPKLPAISGIETFEGKSFHTSRWNYDITGGSQEDPVLEKLKDKRVGIIGTGATAVQCVPHLAKYAKHLTVFQRTPSSVDIRGQRPTSNETWKSVATSPGWWKKRNISLARNLSQAETAPDNLVDDYWTKSTAYRALIGGPGGPSKPEDIPRFVARLHALDFPRAERVRQRVDDIVKDEKTASSLKAFYPVFCKRPCFHEDFLPVFNESNVTLVDTDGRGVDNLTATGAAFKGQEYPLDILIFSTGFRSPLIGAPGFRAGMTIKGRNGRDIDERWKKDLSTLHGCITRDFPNFFFPGPWQSGVGANANFSANVVAGHAAQMISQAEARYPGEKVVIEPTVEAEQMWTGEILKRSMAFAGTAGCTPSYLNLEGAIDKIPMEMRMDAARASPWGEGIEGYMNVVEAWERDGKLAGLDVKVV